MPSCTNGEPPPSTGFTGIWFTLSTRFTPFFIEGDGPDDAAKKKAGEAAQNFVIFFSENRLYYDPELVEQVGRLHSILNEAWATLVYDLRNRGQTMPQPERERQLQVWRRARDIVLDEAPKLREQIETIMRRLLDPTK